MTNNAKLIMDIINASCDHLTAEQIFLLLKEKDVKISLATVYNSLAFLYDEGLVRKVVVEGYPDRYDRVRRHDHLVCVHCGRLMDVTLEDLTASLQHEVNVPIISYDLKISCICDECSKKERRI